MKLSKQIETEVISVHNLFWDAYAKRDIDLRFSLCTEDVTFIGSGLHERALNKTEYKNINKEGVKQFPDPFQIEFLWTNLTMLNDNVACVESEVVWSQRINNEMSKELLRNTTLLKCENNKWLVTHVHGSVPDYRLKQGDYMTNEQTIIRNRELERQVFERTQDLNKTLEELEQKNRELEIEASLERVRAVAMSMNKSDDLLSICEVSFKEFKKLGFDNLRNSLIHILDDAKEFFLDYDFSDSTGGNISRIFYKSHPIVENYLAQIKSAEDAFAEIVINGSELNDWKDFRLKTGQQDDPRLNNIQALYYYGYSIGVGDISISTFKPIDESQIQILKRFRNVFDLAYRRYIDIALAEAQAREAQIELALERVRAKSLAMQQTSELQEVVNEVAQQLLQMKIDMDGGVIIIINDEVDRDVPLWGSAGAANYVQKVTAPYLDIPIINRMISAIKKRESFLIERYTKEEKDEFMQHLFRHHPWDKVSQERKNELLSREGGYCRSMSISRHTSIAIINHHGRAFSEADNNILKRFGNVLEQSYTRFLDLKNAEAQARDAQIELALERVRARTMGMQKSEELKEVIRVVYDQFVHLKINVDHAGFVVDYTPKGDWHFWIADERDIPSKIKHPYFESVWANQFNEAKEKDADFFATNLNFEEKNKFYNELLAHVPGLPEASKDFYLSCPGLAATTVLFDNVSLYIENFSGIPYSDVENKILIRFGKVFQQTYTRFLDLQKAEAQAREAKIEAALERTRTQSMLMQHSIELNDISKIFHEQLLLLGINSEFSFVWLPNEEKDEHLFWATWVNNVNAAQQFHSKAINYPMDKTEPYTAACFAAWESDEPVHEYYVPPEEIENFFKSWEELLKGAEQFKPELFPEGIYYTEAYMKYGCFGIDIRRKLAADEKEIIRRFAVEFERTYTRFLDLKKAEAQAREAQIEASLEKVRTVALSLKKSDEMLDIAQVLYEQLIELGFNNIRNAIIDIHNDKNETFLDYDYSHDMGRTVTLMSYYDDPIIEKQVRQIESSSDAFFEIILEGQDLQDLIDIRLKNGEEEDPRLRKIEQLTYSLYSFGNGAIGISNFGLLSDEQKIVLKRFRNVFAFAYKRYTDMVSAETQAREAKKQASLDRIRAEIASMRTSEDLNRITPIIWRELKNLEVPFIRCGVFIVDEAKEKVHVYLTTPEGKSLGVMHLSFDANNLTSDTVDYWKKKQIFKQHWNKLEFINWTKSLIEIGQVQSAETYQGSAAPPESLNLHFVPFTQGMIYVGDTSPLTDEKLALVKTVAEAFSIAYARYEDFKNLEDAKNKIELTLSELKSAQVQLIHSEKMASLGELTAGIAHEIKNPLNFVNNFSEVSRELLDEMIEELKNQNTDEVVTLIQDLKQNLEKINQHGKRADSIVKGMLLHSRGSSGEKTLIDINELLDQYVTLAYHGLRAQDKKFNISIEKHYDDTLGKLNVVPQDISRVFLNIINNACYAAYDRKKKSENDFNPVLKVSTKNLNGKVEIRISDNGNGIPEDILDKIFQPFFTTKPTGEGTGLGLSLSYDIVTKVHGGELKAETKESEGTEFIIMLPKV